MGKVKCWDRTEAGDLTSIELQAMAMEKAVQAGLDASRDELRLLVKAGASKRRLKTQEKYINRWVQACDLIAGFTWSLENLVNGYRKEDECQRKKTGKKTPKSRKSTKRTTRKK
jgi:hypothetical protein